MRSHTAGQEILSLTEPGNIFGICLPVLACGHVSIDDIFIKIVN